MLTSSNSIPLGYSCPDFDLVDVVTGDKVTLKSFSENKLLLVIFTARHCPYAQHVKDGIAKLGRDYIHKKVGVVGICSSDISAYPLDAPDNLAEMAKEINLNFPLCFDESQEAAKSFKAACTPDFYLFDNQRKLIYHGQMDASRPGNGIPVSGRNLREAIEAALENRPLPAEQVPSIGCGIKWKPGNEP